MSSAMGGLINIVCVLGLIRKVCAKKISWIDDDASGMSGDDVEELLPGEWKRVKGRQYIINPTNTSQYSETYKHELTE